METETRSKNYPYSPYYVTLGAALRRTRLALRLSLQSVEDRSGGRFPTALIGGYERGTRRAHVETLRDLAAFYGVPLRTFLPDEDEGTQMVPLDAMIAQLEALRGVEA